MTFYPNYIRAYMFLSYKWMDGWVWDRKSLCGATLRASLCDANNRENILQSWPSFAIYLWQISPAGTCCCSYIGLSILRRPGLTLISDAPLIFPLQPDNHCNSGWDIFYLPQCKGSTLGCTKTHKSKKIWSRAPKIDYSTQLRHF